jgi:hypothetical protein
MRRKAVTVLGMPARVPQVGQVRLGLVIIDSVETVSHSTNGHLYCLEQPRSQKDAKW